MTTKENNATFELLADKATVQVVGLQPGKRYAARFTLPDGRAAMTTAIADADGTLTTYARARQAGKYQFSILDGEDEVATGSFTA